MRGKERNYQNLEISKHFSSLNPRSHSPSLSLWFPLLLCWKRMIIDGLVLMAVLSLIYRWKMVKWRGQGRNGEAECSWWWWTVAFRSLLFHLPKRCAQLTWLPISFLSNLLYFEGENNSFFKKNSQAVCKLVGCAKGQLFVVFLYMPLFYWMVLCYYY